MADFCRELEACLADLQGAGTQIAPALAPARRRPRRGLALPVLFAVLVLAAAGAIAAYFVLRDSGSGSRAGAGGGAGGAPIHLKAVTAYDPYGDNHYEHNDKAYLATDSSPDTYWETERYDTAPSLGKPGVGLVLDAERSVQLHQLGFSTSTPGLTAEIRAGNARSGPFDAVVGASQTVGSTQQVRYDIRNGRYRYYVIWITRLGPGYHTARINDVRAN